MPAAGQQRRERLDVARVELAPGDAAQLGHRLKGRHPVAVGVLGGQRVVDLGDGDDARDLGDLVALQAVAGSRARRCARGGRARSARPGRRRRGRAAGRRRARGAGGSPPSRPAVSVPWRSMTRSGSAKRPMSCSRPAVCASSASRLLIPHSSAMSRANAATAALWRAVRPSRRSSERTSADSTPHDSAAYCPARWRAMTTSRDM